MPGILGRTCFRGHDFYRPGFWSDIFLGGFVQDLYGCEPSIKPGHGKPPEMVGFYVFLRGDYFVDTSLRGTCLGAVRKQDGLFRIKECENCNHNRADGIGTVMTLDIY